MSHGMWLDCVIYRLTWCMIESNDCLGSGMTPIVLTEHVLDRGINQLQYTSITYSLEPQLLLPPIFPPERLHLTPPTLDASISLGRQTQQVILIQKLIRKPKDICAPHLLRIPLLLLLRGGRGVLVLHRRVTRRIWWRRRFVDRVRGDLRVRWKVGQATGPEEGDEVGLDLE